MIGQKRIGTVVKAKNVHKGDRVCLVIHEETATRQEWAEVTDVFSDGYGTSMVTVCFGEGFDNQDSLRPSERVLVLR